jgi:hypothetical protein
MCQPYKEETGIGDDTHGVVTVLLGKSKHGAVALMPLAKQGTVVLMN